jgi:UDP-glucose 4-epimerase
MEREVLITGGAGFIGSELTRQAVQRGFKVTVVDNLLNGRLENLNGIPRDRFRLIIADIRDTTEMKKIMQGIDIIYHLACLCVRHSIHSPKENHEVNATATLNLIDIGQSAGICRFVFTSSAEVYGSACCGAVTEDNSLKPTNAYGAAKLAAEGYAMAYYHTHGFPSVVLRLFNTYGPRCHHEGDCGEVIPKFLLRSMIGRPLVIFGDGTQTRDFNYVEDTARAVLIAGLTDKIIGKTINIGSGRETSINELAHRVMAVTGEKVDIIHDKPRLADIARMFADGTKARDLLGYRPTIRLEDGLLRLKEWYCAQGNSLEELACYEVVHNWDRDELNKSKRN